MKTIVGIFKTPREAAEAANLLRRAGFEGNNVIILSPGTSDIEVAAAVPTEDAEQPGMGKAIGSVIGGAVGLGAGALIANLLLPGIGPVLAVTFGAAGRRTRWRRSWSCGGRRAGKPVIHWGAKG